MYMICLWIPQEKPIQAHHTGILEAETTQVVKVHNPPSKTIKTKTARKRFPKIVNNVYYLWKKSAKAKFSIHYTNKVLWMNQTLLFIEKFLWIIFCMAVELQGSF